MGGGGGAQHVSELQILYGKPKGKELLVISRGRFSISVIGVCEVDATVYQ